MVDTEQNTQFVIHRTEKANSYEFGKAGNRFKIFFDTDNLYDEICKLKKTVKGLGIALILLIVFEVVRFFTW